MYSKRYLKAEKNEHKRRLPMIISTIIFTDSIYRKDENYYPKAFLEKYYSIEDRNFFEVILMKNIIMKNVSIYF